MDKQEQISLILKAIGVLQSLPVLASHSEEVSMLKNILKLLHDEVYKEVQEAKTITPSLTGENTNHASVN